MTYEDDRSKVWDKFFVPLTTPEERYFRDFFELGQTVQAKQNIFGYRHIFSIVHDKVAEDLTFENETRLQ